MSNVSNKTILIVEYEDDIRELLIYNLIIYIYNRNK